MGVAVRLVWLGLALTAVVFAPLVLARLNYPAPDIEEIAPADAALVFGALVRGGVISPLHAERLAAARALLEDGKVSRIVVSNAPQAAQEMAVHLVKAGVPAQLIEIDGTAIKTPDTCKAELARPKTRRVVFVSQSFHLPRISVHCARLGLLGQGLAAEAFGVPDGEALPLWRVAQIRIRRHLREAVLLWSVILGVYR